MLKFSFPEGKIENEKGHVFGVWLNDESKPIHDSSYFLLDSADLPKNYLFHYKNILKPGDVISCPGGLIDYNLCLFFKICDEKNYNLLARNIFQTIKAYKDDGNICKEVSIYMIPQVNFQTLILNLKKYEFKNINFKFYKTWR